MACGGRGPLAFRTHEDEEELNEVGQGSHWQDDNRHGPDPPAYQWGKQVNQAKGDTENNSIAHEKSGNKTEFDLAEHQSARSGEVK